MHTYTIFLGFKLNKTIISTTLWYAEFKSGVISEIIFLLQTPILSPNPNLGICLTANIMQWLLRASIYLPSIMPILPTVLLASDFFNIKT